MAPAVEVAKHGFPLGQASRHYLEFVHDSVYGTEPASRSVLHDEAGELLAQGATVVIPDLSESLAAIAATASRRSTPGISPAPSPRRSPATRVC